MRDQYPFTRMDIPHHIDIAFFLQQTVCLTLRNDGRAAQAVPEITGVARPVDEHRRFPDGVFIMFCRSIDEPIDVALAQCIRRFRR